MSEQFRKICVIGASKGLGRLIAENLEAKGFRVNALARSARPADLAGGVVWFQGSAVDEALVNEAVRGCESVIMAIGIKPTLRAVNVFSESTRVVVGAMTSQGIRRLICITGIGAGDSRGHGGFLYDWLLRPTLLRTTYSDKDRQEEIVRRSNLDWTIVRPGLLTNGINGSHHVRTSTRLEGITARKVPRVAVAAWCACAAIDGHGLRGTLLVD